MALVTHLSSVDDIYLLKVDGDPSLASGTTLENGDPITAGSLAFWLESGQGRISRKDVTASATAWSLIDTNANDWSLAGNTLTGTATNPNELFGSLSNHDVRFIRNNVQAFKAYLMDSGNTGVLIGQALDIPAGFKEGLVSKAIPAGLQFSESELHTDGTNFWEKYVQNRKIQANSVGVNLTTALFSIALEDNSLYFIEAMIMGRQIGGSAGTTGATWFYKRFLAVRSISGVLTVRQNASSFTHEDEQGATFDVTVPTPVGLNLVINVVQSVQRNVVWVGSLDVKRHSL
jgi:hypothetical protein